MINSQDPSNILKKLFNRSVVSTIFINIDCTELLFWGVMIAKLNYKCICKFIPLQV